MAADALVSLSRGMRHQVLSPVPAKTEEAYGVKTLLGLDIAVVIGFDTPGSARKLHGVGKASLPARQHNSVDGSSLSINQFRLCSQ